MDTSGTLGNMQLFGTADNSANSLILKSSFVYWNNIFWMKVFAVQMIKTNHFNTVQLKSLQNGKNLCLNIVLHF